jgi:poly(3-hydroxybutyrate) depolymerase
MSAVYSFIVATLMVVSLVVATQPRTDVTVSGISSGGAMATQLHFALSKEISGCGILAGPPYYCAGNGMTMVLCMTGPSAYISTTALQQTIKTYALTGSIDDPATIINDPVYVFSGKYDSVVYPGTVKLNEDLYSRFGANVKTNFDMSANHCFPTESYGAECAVLNKKSYINDW